MNKKNKVHVKTGDTVIIISGKYASGKEPTIGKVLQVSPDEGKVIVEKACIVTKHVKPKKQGEAGGKIEAESAIYASKVQLYCPKCQKGVRIRNKVTANGEKIRSCVHCGETI
ncbi:MAG: 50S ribosomal protein L24 [Eubacteriales bacterium]|nr:50S ribosomal protein L24 [Eubacteriales bacterium]MDD4422703.1 50S ribosomal protein L24 [Eubacteriales bacterium]